MEFKVFKNENSKILKEYWLTQSEWDALDKSTVQEGDIYHIVGTIDKGDLSADVNASLAKADSSLQKPTATLAKESFVKVGIDGSQNFDENSYVVAPSVDGTAGQVLKKTASGTEWANDSGGGGGTDTLEAKLNENIIKDPSKTYLVWKGNQFPNSTNATFKAPEGCTIDWGDGNVETFETASTEVNTHTYTDGFEYHLISLSNYTLVDDSAFYNCSGLTNVTIPDSVTSIGNYAFRNCSGLTSVTIGNSVTSIGVWAFYNCSRLTSITIPDSVTSIGTRAFYGCSRLTSVTIPNRVTSIGDGTFSGCTGLTSAIIGNGVTSIGNYAFKNCSGLKNIKMSSITPPALTSTTFTDSPIEKIIVPKSAIDSYKTATGWSTYADKIVYEVDSSDLIKGDPGPQGPAGQVIVDTCQIDGEKTIEGERYSIQVIANVFNNNITDFASFLTATKNKTIPSNGYIAINEDDPQNAELCSVFSIENIYQENSQTYLIKILYMYQNNVTVLSLGESDLTNFTMVVEKW